MFDELGITAVLYATGSLLIKLFGFGHYKASLTRELNDPFYVEERQRQEDGRILLRADTVCIIGFFFWLAVLTLLIAGFWSGRFDAITPLKDWLFAFTQMDRDELRMVSVNLEEATELVQKAG